MTASIRVKWMSLVVAISHPRQVPKRDTTATPIRSNVLSGGEVFIDAPKIKDGGEVQKDDSQTEI